MAEKEEPKKVQPKDKRDMSHLWLVSYSDFMTILMIFFLGMYGYTYLAKQALLKKQTQISYTEFTQLMEKLKGDLTDDIEIREDQQKIIVDLPTRILFKSAEAALNKKARRTIAEIGNSIKLVSGPIIVEGHTDNVPISKANFKSNWELSAARAFSVIEVLTAQGVPGERLSAWGFGEHRPVASNETREGRSKNRRIGIVLLKEQEKLRRSFRMPGERIVIVDDDEQVASYVQLSFSLNGYKVEWVRDGKKAVQLISESVPDAVILDLKLPGINGFRICEQLRAEPRTRGIPIIVVSGSWKNAEDRIRSIEVGADDFLTKPFDAQELMARIKRMLQRKQIDMGHNPLTGLPGNLSIEEETRRRLARGGSNAYAYIDLDNFKAYNDNYGVKQGDKVIRLFADILVEAVKRWGNATDFVGHVGGDDFFTLTSEDRAQSMFDWIAKRFDERIKAYYSETDLKAGYIVAKDRQGNTKQFPFVSASIVYLVDRNLESNQYPHLIESLTEMKGYVKHSIKRNGGSYVFQDRRDPKPGQAARPKTADIVSKWKQKKSA